MSPPVDTSMSLHPTAVLTQQMGQLSLGSTGAVSNMDFPFKIKTILQRFLKCRVEVVCSFIKA